MREQQILDETLAALSVPGFARVNQNIPADTFRNIIGDAANITDQHGHVLPQLGSVAQQSGAWAAHNIVANLSGKPTRPFEYHDKGIMAMVGRNAAVAELGEDRHELTGPLAFAAWLGVHASLLSGVREKVGALASRGQDYVSKKRPTALVDHPEDYRIDWDDEG